MLRKRHDKSECRPAEMRIKLLLSNEIALAIEDKALNQKAAAELTCLKQPDISRIANGNVGDYSVWRLMRTLSLLGKDIVIDIHQSTKSKAISTRTSPPRNRRQDVNPNQAATAEIFPSWMTACVRLSTFSFSKIAETCALMVASETPSS